MGMISRFDDSRVKTAGAAPANRSGSSLSMRKGGRGRFQALSIMVFDGFSLHAMVS
jgi:hypothetical protein